MAVLTKKELDIFIRAFHYIKDNAVIGYSLALLLLVPAAFFYNNYRINIKYGEAIDEITRQKAVLVEDVLNKYAYEKINDREDLQETVSRIKLDNYEILSLSILKQKEGQAAYEVIASSNQETVGTEVSESNQIIFAQKNKEGIAQLDEAAGSRFWRVTKAIRGGDENELVGFLEMSLSLAEPDATMNEAISLSYKVLAIVVLVLVLIMANQIRLLEIALSLNRLMEVDKMKDMFISMASHELRAPLTAIKGYLELLREKDNLNLDDESSRYLDNIVASSHRLEHLVEDMLEVSRLEGNRFPLEFSDFDPDPLIKQSVEEMRSQAIKKGLALEYIPYPLPATVRADTSRVKQVVVNLIGNALKYTEKGSVKVTTAVKKDTFLITVADTGIGISSEEQANLFQKFYRVKNEKTRDISGTGLGLWITMETVRRMKGKITVESIEGVGSHFTINLPLVKK